MIIFINIFGFTHFYQYFWLYSTVLLFELSNHKCFSGGNYFPLVALDKISDGRD